MNHNYHFFNLFLVFHPNSFLDLFSFSFKFNFSVDQEHKQILREISLEVKLMQLMENDVISHCLLTNSVDHNLYLSYFFFNYLFLLLLINSTKNFLIFFKLLTLFLLILSLLSDFDLLLCLNGKYDIISSLSILSKYYFLN